MSSISIALLSAGCIILGALIGLGLQRLLPGSHLGKETQDVVKLSAGMIATLTALVLGLLVSSAKSSFDTMNTSLVQSSAKMILLDRALARFGPETTAVREQFKHGVAATIETLWPAKKSDTTGLSVFERANGAGLDLVQDKLNELTPQNETQRQALARAQGMLGDLDQTRWLLIEQEQNQLPFPLLLILVFWLALLFASFSLFAPGHVTSLTVLFVGACAVSAAIFLVLELSKPLEGFIQLSSAPLRNAMQHLGQ